MLFQTTKTFLQGTNDKMFGDRRVFELVAWSVLVDCLQVMISFPQLHIFAAVPPPNRHRRQQPQPREASANEARRCWPAAGLVVGGSHSTVLSFTYIILYLCPPLLRFDPLICGRRLGPRPTLSGPSSACGVRPPPELGRSSPAGGGGTPTRPHPLPRALAGCCSPPPPLPPGR